MEQREQTDCICVKCSRVINNFKIKNMRSNCTSCRYCIVACCSCNSSCVYKCPLCPALHYKAKEVVSCYHKHPNPCSLACKCVSMDDFITKHLIGSIPLEQVTLRITGKRQRKHLEQGHFFDTTDGQTPKFLKTSTEFPQSGTLFGDLLGMEPIGGDAIPLDDDDENIDITGFNDEYVEDSQPTSTLSFESTDVTKIFDIEISKEMRKQSAEYLKKCSLSFSKLTRQPPILCKPLTKMKGVSPFRTLNCLDFTVNHFLRNNLSRISATKLINDLRTKYVTNGDIDIPYSYYEMMTALNSIDTMKPLPIAETNCSKSVIYNLSEIIANVLNNDQLMRRMVFTLAPDISNNTYITELYHSEGWNNAIRMMNYVAPDALPILMLLFYDDFRKYKLAPGYCGGLYVSVLNMERNLISRPENIFCLGLISSDDEYWEVMECVTKQFVELNSLKSVYCACVGSYVQVIARMGLFLADTPQRQDNCQMKRQNASVNCIVCFSDRNSCLNISKTLDPIDGIEIKPRTVENMRLLYAEWNEAYTDSTRRAIAKNYGLSPHLNQDGSFKENPLFQLYDLYKFDIYQDSPLDLFHIILKGVFPSHIEMLSNQLQTGELAYLKEKLKELGCSLKYEQREYWLGDHWLQFFKYTPFLYHKVLIEYKPSVAKTSHYSILVKGCRWMAILLSRNISQNDINDAEKLWMSWFTMLPKVFTVSEIANKPNFHNSSHLFEFARKWGPPVCYWARPFEHKHKVFKNLIAKSSHKDEMDWCGNRESIIQSLRFVYPHIKFHNYKEKEIKVNSNIRYVDGNDHTISYGVVQNVREDELDIIPLKCNEISDYHHCPRFQSMQRQEQITIPMNCFIEHFAVTDGYVNLYARLNAI